MSGDDSYDRQKLGNGMQGSNIGDKAAMLGKKIMVIAVLLYGAVVGCVMWSSTPAKQQDESSPGGPGISLAPIQGLRPYRGVAIQLQNVNEVAEYEKTIDIAANDGVDTVSLVVDARQENKESLEIYVDMRKTMTVAQLTEIIGHAKSRGLRVILFPLVLLDAPIKDEWRGQLEPREGKWDDWFDSYREMITHYARIAQNSHVDLLSVGSELVTTEKHPDQWIKTIKAVRDIYHGQLTYSSNWDRYQKVPFWNYLDLIGINAYWTLGEDNKVSLDQIKKNWIPIQDEVVSFSQKMHKPVVLMEVGWCSLANAAHDPWDYTQTQLDADPDLQRRMYEAFFQSWWGNPRLAGFILWEMRPGGDSDGKGYDPQGKPAEQVMRQWLRKPAWELGTE
jgi:hypothetical protein